MNAACSGLQRHVGRGAVSRRQLLTAGLAVTALGALQPKEAFGRGPFRFGLTPVFLTNDLELLTRLQGYLARTTGYDVALVQRRTYQEITSLLISEQLDAAWICGFPYVAYREQLALVAVPLWQQQPLYRSYLISAADRDTERLEQLQGDIHAFSDPDSNSGHLVTRAALAEIGRRPEEFFKRTIFTYSHRNVVRAVGSSLAASGSVDGYVWEVLSETEPALTERTRVVLRSELLGFPPIACSRRQAGTAAVRALKQALLQMPSDTEGRAVLNMLRLDGFTEAQPDLFNGIAEKVAQVRRLG